MPPIPKDTSQAKSKTQQKDEAEKTPLVSRHDLIEDVVMTYPEAAEVLMDFGVGCAGCHISAFETLEEGILGHGFSEEELEEVLADLNEIAEGVESAKLS